eukprot:Skav222859  [mRNA]  locus=scaffold2201:54474:54689:- [translate_table: standard]
MRDGLGLPLLVGAQLRYAIAMSFVGKPKDQMLPYIKSMQAAAKMANNADLLMVMQKSDSKHMTAPCPGWCR